MSGSKNTNEVQNATGGDDDKEVFPPKVLKRVEFLEKIHDRVGEIDKEYKKERAALEHKYSALRQVLFDERKQVIAGSLEAPDNEGVEGDEVGVPGFWFRALANHPAIGDFITEEDIPALEALTNISVIYNESYSSFKLTFHFAENPFFSNQTLEKSYELTPDILEEKSPTLASSTGTVIQWKPSKDLTVTEIKKKQKAKSGKNKGQVRTVTRLEPKASFFHYFSEPVEEPEEENEEEEESPNVKIGIEDDYDIAHAVRTDIIPDAVKWFTGEAVPDDLDYDDEDGDEEEEEDEEEEDDDDDDDDMRKAPVKSKGGKGKPTGFAAPGGAGAAGGENPECKQN